ncbi:uncharacterized protein LOC126735586 isoform X4 [Anthonomus grandis grandis]|nr:uncharacterized protein LOC126735586 isoform X2 [Anthonomus grandis grandis]XP_050295578.1 uncharacterized protein LOC126735586 isoform X3 [Anthonomus grandis grandis]XP_050295579.1 uncharacterized protein LOC126735586 isoform X4 [Anthonomus grandis grandis]
MSNEKGNKPLVITGEASETESEEEISPELQMHLTNSIQGAVILGEDSESDNENEGSIASAVSALQLLEEISDNEIVDHDSLLQQKLCESNVSLYTNIESFIQSTVDEAGKNLNAIEHQLLKSQITLQGAVSSLKTLSVNSLTLKNKLHSLLTSKFLPNISNSKKLDGGL